MALFPLKPKAMPWACAAILTCCNQDPKTKANLTWKIRGLLTLQKHKHSTIYMAMGNTAHKENRGIQTLLCQVCAWTGVVHFHLHRPYAHLSNSLLRELVQQAKNVNIPIEICQAQVQAVPQLITSVLELCSWLLHAVDQQLDSVLTLSCCQNVLPT